MNSFIGFCSRVTKSHTFDHAILAIIILNAVVIGFETSATLVAQYGQYFKLFNHIVLGIFVVEAFLKIVAEAPRIDRYFRQGWNLFDFSIVVLSFLPASGEFATAARLVRVLRVARVITMVPELRLIIATLLRSLPSIVHIVSLLGVLFYIYGIIGHHIFHQTDPARWGSFGASLLTLFGIVTLENWVDTMQALLGPHPLAWIYFLSFIIMGTFTFINLFVAVVINNLSEAKKEALEELESPITKNELLKELQKTKEALVRLEARLEKRES